MQFHNNILTITVPELVKCGLSENYLKKALYDQRKGLVSCWQHHKDGRRVYVHYETLKAEYKEKVKTIICGGVEPEIYVTNTTAIEQTQKLNTLFSQLPYLLEPRAETLNELTLSGLLTPNDAQRITRAEAWLKLFRNMKVKTARAYGCESVKDMQAEIFNHYLSEQAAGWVLSPKPINNIEVFGRLARKWSKEGYTVLVSKYLGNQNRAKVDTLIHAKLLELACNPVKYSFEDIGLYYNDFAEANGLEKITVSAIKAHLNQPKIKRVWYYLRHGKNEGDRVMRQQIERNTPSRPDALWSVDGTSMQLYYKGNKGLMCSDLYVIFVTDCYSGAIIGSSVGYVENSGLVIEALQDAIVTRGYKPYQLQYDNSSANISTAVKSLMQNMTHVNFPCRPEAAQSKYVESIIGHFQQRVLRHRENFKGGNITATSPNSKANPELLKRLKNNIYLLPTESEAINDFKEAINEYNARGKRNAYGQCDGATKLDRYNEAHPDREKLNYFERIGLFMVEVPNTKDKKNGLYKYKQQGIEITIRGAKYHFIVPDDTNGDTDFDFARNNLYKGFKVRVNVAVEMPHFIALYDEKGRFIGNAYEKQRFASCLYDMKGQDMSKIKQFIARADAEGYTAAQTELEEQRKVLERAGFWSATGTDGGYTGWQDTPKVIHNSIQNKTEDKLNGVFETTTTLTELEKRLSSFGG